MSLLLKSLKKADQEGQEGQTATPEEEQQAQAGAQPTETPATPEAPPVAPTPPPVAPIMTAAPGGSAGASRLVTPPPAAPAPAPSAAPIDFDSVAEDGEQAETPAERDLVSASRVFRAGEEEEKGKSGGSFIYGILALLLCLGGGAGVVYTGVIPGVTVASVLNMLGGGSPQVVPTQPTGSSIPELTTAGADGEALSLPRPKIDVQDEVVVNFAGFGENDGALGSAEGRRAIVERIAAFTSVEEEEAVEAIDNTLLLESLEEEIRIESENEGLVEEEVVEVEEIIKTAEVSRERKRSLDTRTPVDRLLLDSVKIKTIGGVPVEDLPKADSAEGPAGAGSPPIQPERVAQADEEVEVTPSLSGAERREMLQQANQLHVKGSYERAEKIYRSILDKNPTNVDALRGLALAAVAGGRYQLGVGTYLKILEYYPSDSVALADLANLHGASGENFFAIERALKNNIGKQPQWDGRLHFALGNLYTERERWLDAQKSYFEAFSGDPRNPDYAYNLAVVLDYLNKPTLAVNYYRQALELSAHTRSGFDAAPVRARIRDISQ